MVIPRITVENRWSRGRHNAGLPGERAVHARNLYFIAKDIQKHSGGEYGVENIMWMLASMAVTTTFKVDEEGETDEPS